MNQRRKEEILQYPNNSNKLTKAQQYAHTSNNLKFNLAKNFNEEKDVLLFLKSRNKDLYLYDLSHTTTTITIIIT